MEVMSLTQAGNTENGIGDIMQCLKTILFTRKGTDPFRPDFGCGVLDLIDRPVNETIPAMKKEIIEAISLYEPRVTILSIKAQVVSDDE